MGPLFSVFVYYCYALNGPFNLEINLFYSNFQRKLRLELWIFHVENGIKFSAIFFQIKLHNDNSKFLIIIHRRKADGQKRFSIINTNIYIQGGQRTSYIWVFFIENFIMAEINCSTIWQNKINFYTILTTNLYDKSQTKVSDGLV